MIPCVSALRSPVRVSAALLCLSLVVTGCGGGGAAKGGKPSKPRVKAEGTVKYDGNALAFGTILFTSKDTGNPASCQIKDGAFVCAADDGPNPGENAVLISGKETADGPPTWLWTSKVDVPEGGLTGKDFAVEAKATKKPPKPNPDD